MSGGEPQRLAEMLADGMVHNGLRRPQITSAWRGAMRDLLYEATADEIQTLIIFACQDKFWRTKINSAAMLRQEYPKLRLDATDKGALGVFLYSDAEQGWQGCVADAGRLTSLWPTLLGLLREGGSELASHVLAGGHPVGVDLEQGVLEVGFPPSASFNKRKAEADTDASDRLTGAIHALTGVRLRPAYVLLEAEGKGT